MSINFSRRPKKVREVPLTAIIDVVFILIFFFMLTTSFMRIESMPVVLPSTGSPAQSDIKTERMTLRGDELIEHNGSRVTLEALMQQLSQQQDIANTQYVIFMDGKVSLQRMVMVMDKLQMLGGKAVYVRPLGSEGK